MRHVAQNETSSSSTRLGLRQVRLRHFWLKIYVQCQSNLPHFRPCRTQMSFILNRVSHFDPLFIISNYPYALSKLTVSGIFGGAFDVNNCNLCRVEFICNCFIFSACVACTHKLNLTQWMKHFFANSLTWFYLDLSRIYGYHTHHFPSIVPSVVNHKYTCASWKFKTVPERVRKRFYDVGLRSFQYPKIRLRLPLRRD